MDVPPGNLVCWLEREPTANREGAWGSTGHGGCGEAQPGSFRNTSTNKAKSSACSQGSPSSIPPPLQHLACWHLLRKTGMSGPQACPSLLCSPLGITRNEQGTVTSPRQPRNGFSPGYSSRNPAQPSPGVHFPHCRPRRDPSRGCQPHHLPGKPREESAFPRRQGARSRVTGRSLPGEMCIAFGLRF